MRQKFPVAVHLFLRRGDQILLLRRCNTGYADGCYSVPAGHLDGCEPVRQAAAREAREEIGIALDPADLTFAGVFHRCEDDERIDFFVQATSWQGEPFNAEPDKCDALLWADLHHLPANTIPYVRQALENFAAGLLFQEFGWSPSPKGHSLTE